MLNINYDLNKLLKWAQDKSISLNIEYCEPSDELTISTSSPSRSERYFLKKCSVNSFMDAWEEHFNFFKLNSNLYTILDNIDSSTNSRYFLCKRDYITLYNYISFINKNNVKSDHIIYYSPDGEVEIRELL